MNLGTATTLADGKLTYHETVVCELLPNGKTRLNSGGWRTATTKKRMNQFAEAMGFPWRIREVNRKWVVNISDNHRGTAVLFFCFYDGMEV